MVLLKGSHLDLNVQFQPECVTVPEQVMIVVYHAVRLVGHHGSLLQ